MAITSRLQGTESGVAVKAPCRVATTTSITGVGLQTIDGVALAAGDRVLVKNQTNSIDNGIYVAGTGTWERALDFDGSRDAVKGTIVFVSEGTANLAPSGAPIYRVGGTNPIIVGSSAITFTRLTIAATADSTEATIRAAADIAEAATRLTADNALDARLDTAETDIDALQIAIALAALGTVVTVKKTTQALLYADLAHVADTIALVYADATASKNDLYVKSGASGAGSWSAPLGIFATYAQALVATQVTAAEDAADAAAASADAAAASVSGLTLLSNNSSERLPPPVFLKGVWLQPASLMATWAARGINTMITGCADAAEGAGTGDAWDAEAAAHDFYLIRRPGRQFSTVTDSELDAYLRADDLNPKVIAWNLPDEPDLSGGTPSYLPMTKRELSNLCNRWREISQTMPINCDVSDYLWTFNQRGLDFTSIHDISWWTGHAYPANHPSGASTNAWLRPRYQGASSPFYLYVTTAFGLHAQDFIQNFIANQFEYNREVYTAARYKPCFAFVSTSAYAPTQTVTAAGFRADCWTAVINGVSGIHYFPQNISNPSFEFDNTPADILTEMENFHDNIATLEALDVLFHDYATTGLRGRRLGLYRPSASSNNINLLNTAADPVSGTSWKAATGTQMQGGFEGLEVEVGAETYFIVMNLCGVTMSLSDTRWGLTSVSFPPYEVACYAASAPTTNILARTGL